MADTNNKSSSMPTSSISTSTSFVLPTRSSDWILLSQGAEARVYKVPYDDASMVVVKERFPKAYRHPALDERLTKLRTRAEARILQKCSDKGLKVPQVLHVQANTLYLQHLDGYVTLRDELERILADDGDSEDAASAVARSLGRVLAQMHALGIVHGDLTTSNMMVKEPSPDIFLIDFGLAKNTTSAEERAVDLYVLERALTSTHPKLPDTFSSDALRHYQESEAWRINDGGQQHSHKSQSPEATLTRLEQVRQRGRKRECFG